MKKHTVVALAAILSLPALAQHTQSVTIGDNASYGLTYNLPKTQLQVAVSATKTLVVAGQFAPYAEKFLGLKDVAQTDAVMYEVGQITVQSMPVADPDRTFHINFSEKGANPTFFLTDDRCLCAINRQPAGLVAVDKAETPVAADAGKPHYKPSDVMTPEILKAGSKAKQAELCAQEIMSIRESRNELIRGEADNTPNDGKQLQLMLDNLSAQEDALMSLFVGSTTVTPVQQTFLYTPSAEVERDVLFRFSGELGFLAADDLAGSPYYLSLSLEEDNRLSFTDPKAVKKMEKGIAFCVPGKVRFRLFTLRSTLAEGVLPMAQFGHVEQLPQAQFTNAKKPCSAQFEPSTGAIRIFEQ